MIAEIISVLLSLGMLACMWLCCVRFCKCPTICGTLGRLLMNLAMLSFALASLEHTFSFLTGYEPIFTGGLAPPWRNAGALDELLGNEKSHLNFLRESRKAAKARHKAEREKFQQSPTTPVDNTVFAEVVHNVTMQRFAKTQKEKAKPKPKRKSKTHAAS